MPGSSFHAEALDGARAPFRPAFLTKEERKEFNARQRHAEMSEEEKNKARREMLDKEKVCEDAEGPSERCHIPGLQLSLMFGEGLTFCVNCMDAHETGSLIDSWDAHHGPVKYHVDGRVAIAVPNDARDTIINGHQVKDRLTLVYRGGGVSLLDKVLRVQEAGASAVIIVDQEDGCDENFDCGPFMGQRPADRLSRGFAHQDLASAWRRVYIPAVLIRHEDAQKLTKWLNIGTITLPEGNGEHLVILQGKERAKRRR